MGKRDDAGRARAVIVGAVVNAVGAGAVVIEMGAEDDGLRFKCGIGAFDQTGDVPGDSAAALGKDGAQLDHRAGYVERSRGKFRIDGTLDGGSLLSGRGE